MKIAYVLYPYFTALDLVGPYEVISRWPEAEVHFVARSLEPVRCDRGLTVIPTDTPETFLSNCPEARAVEDQGPVELHRLVARGPGRPPEARRPAAPTACGADAGLS